MGPRLCSRGNLMPSNRSSLRLVWLQWGHGFSAVEIRSRTVKDALHAKASMGPRLFSRGNG